MSNTCSCLTDVVPINLWTFSTSLAAFQLPIYFWLCKPAHCDFNLVSSQQRMPYNESGFGTSLLAAPHRNILAFWNRLRWESNNWMFDCSPEESERHELHQHYLWGIIYHFFTVDFWKGPASRGQYKRLRARRCGLWVCYWLRPCRVDFCHGLAVCFHGNDNFIPWK